MTQQRILIVDDEPKVAFFFQKNLEMINDEYLVTAVNSGEQALQELSQHLYHLLITDLRMPKMDGLQLVRKVKQISPQTKTILITAYGDQKVWDEAKELDTKALSKPIKITDLATVVREALTQNQQKMGGMIALSGENYQLIHNCLEELRVNVGAKIIILADSASQILATTGILEGMEISSTMALLGGTIAASNALVEHLKYEKPVHLSYFEGPPFDIYAINVNQHFFLAIILDRRKESSRIGMVWLYTQRTLKELDVLLVRQWQNDAVRSVSTGLAVQIQQELDTFFENDKETAKPITPKTSPKQSLLYERLQQICIRFQQQTGILVESHLDELEGLPNSPAVSLILKTVGQSLKNVYQHAQATFVAITFTKNAQGINGRIMDDGIGFNMNQPPVWHTFAQLQQEFQKLGGTLEINGYPAQGANVIFYIPV